MYPKRKRSEELYLRYPWKNQQFCILIVLLIRLNDQRSKTINILLLLRRSNVEFHSHFRCILIIINITRLCSDTNNDWGN